MRLATIQREAAAHGLRVRGAFVPDRADAVPPFADGSEAAALVLFGNAGSSLWPAFSASPEYQDDLAHPLDRWSQRIGTEMAAGLGAQVLYPFTGPPFQPFIRWAMKAGNVNASALGMLIDREYGLWHAYRFALALPERLEGQTSNEQADSPCLSCTAKPCLPACPVKAFSGVAYNVNQCVDYLAVDDAASCNHGGCLARRACPVGETYRYQPDHARFHMKAFLTARLASRNDDS